MSRTLPGPRVSRRNVGPLRSCREAPPLARCTKCGRGRGARWSTPRLGAARPPARSPSRHTWSTEHNQHIPIACPNREQVVALVNRLTEQVEPTWSTWRCGMRTRWHWCAGSSRTARHALPDAAWSPREPRLDAPLQQERNVAAHRRRGLPGHLRRRCRRRIGRRTTADGGRSRPDRTRGHHRHGRVGVDARRTAPPRTSRVLPPTRRHRAEHRPDLPARPYNRCGHRPDLRLPLPLSSPGTHPHQKRWDCAGGDRVTGRSRGRHARERADAVDRRTPRRVDGRRGHRAAHRRRNRRVASGGTPTLPLSSP